MESREHACLDAVTWFESLMRLSDMMATGVPLENCLRLSRHLAILAPPPYAAMARSTLDEAAFEALLERRAFETAAVALIGTTLPGEAMPRGGGAKAQVWPDAATKDARPGALALSLLQTWLGSMLALTPGRPAQPTGSCHKSA
ncbi:hypothetical protein [Pelagerythrobacter sp.]|uniref:hypothetical protein n=1 Tax=Pelagerythrobacter sp. TaxID=2800702 RepID=UPI0035AD8CAC